MEAAQVSVHREDTTNEGKPGSRFTVRIDLGRGLAERDRTLLFHVAQHCHIHKLLLGDMDFRFELAADGTDGSEAARPSTRKETET